MASLRFSTCSGTRSAAPLRCGSVQNNGHSDTRTVEPWLQNISAQLSSTLQLQADTFQTVSIPASTPELSGLEYVPDALDEKAAHEAQLQSRAEVEAVAALAAAAFKA